MPYHPRRALLEACYCLPGPHYRAIPAFAQGWSLFLYKVGFFGAILARLMSTPGAPSLISVLKVGAFLTNLAQERRSWAFFALAPLALLHGGNARNTEMGAFVSHAFPLVTPDAQKWRYCVTGVSITQNKAITRSGEQTEGCHYAKNGQNVLWRTFGREPLRK